MGKAVWLLVLLCAATVARADLFVFWQHNPITQAAIDNDPTLANMQSWSVMATHTDAARPFADAGLRAVLPTGQVFYRNPSGGNTRPRPEAIADNPALEFHTYVTQPAQALGGLSPQIWSGFPMGNPVSFGGPNNTVPGTFSVLWFDPFVEPPFPPAGTYELARLTFPSTAIPTIHPQSYVTYGGPDTALIPTVIPEPQVLCAIGAVSATLPPRCRCHRRAQRKLV
jgi:hypothetical protein